MMHHDDGTLEQAEAIHMDEEIIGDRKEIIPSKVSVRKKDSVNVKVTKSTAHLLANRFGGIPGVPVGAKWESRQDCSNAGVHRPFMAGICGTKKTGAFSIVVSCHYKDDKDSGDTIYYTGTGGRKRWSDGFPRKRLRLGPQVFDQQWSDPGNEALVKSRDTGNPVRVVRSHKALSEFAPAEGYRYDGLYTVESAWKEKNPQGLDICRYRLERVPGQPPLLRRSLGNADHELSPTSVATSDTVISPSRTLIGRKRKTQSSARQDDSTIYADAASRKRKLADQAPPKPSPSVMQLHVSAPVLVTFDTPLQQYKKRQQFYKTRSFIQTPVKKQTLPLVKHSMWLSQSQPSSSLARPMQNISYDESIEDADKSLDDEDDEDVLLEDLETTASPFPSSLCPSPL